MEGSSGPRLITRLRFVLLWGEAERDEILPTIRRKLILQVRFKSETQAEINKRDEAQAEDETRL